MTCLLVTSLSIYLSYDTLFKGQNLHITCDHKNTTKLAALLKDDKLLVKCNEPYKRLSTRMRCKYDKKNERTTIVLGNVQLNDTGIYSCQTEDKISGGKQFTVLDKNELPSTKNMATSTPTISTTASQAGNSTVGGTVSSVQNLSNLLATSSVTQPTTRDKPSVSTKVDEPDNNKAITIAIVIGTFVIISIIWACATRRCAWAWACVKRNCGNKLTINTQYTFNATNCENVTQGQENTQVIHQDVRHTDPRQQECSEV
ncbi:uncharacterized protein LOC134181416 isoform X2 [Corticium candelabrum]|uniref:uncharacterized protein LOC134181416 isoform X2 n=1 Tax=Corticium candelabrum TaxID=121492 RepID=UPI002E25862C|nr:uncharacterized protein LOC134181416 isoform X2 [Corticium candelabrum]